MRIAVNTGLCYLPDKPATFRLHGRATIMLNKAGDEFRCVMLDQLILYHELVYNPLYADLRRIAKRSLLGADLKCRLSNQYRYAQSIVNSHTGHAKSVKATDISVVTEWKEVLRKYPRLAYIPLTCLPIRFRGKASLLFRSLRGTK
jgi:hypothetical protein